MTPLPIEPGFYVRPAIVSEVYCLEVVAGRPIWRWWCVGSSGTPREIPVEHMLWVASLPGGLRPLVVN
jgi:hypothetical protein